MGRSRRAKAIRHIISQRGHRLQNAFCYVLQRREPVDRFYFDLHEVVCTDAVTDNVRRSVQRVTTLAQLQHGSVDDCESHLRQGDAVHSAASVPARGPGAVN